MIDTIIIVFLVIIIGGYLIKALVAIDEKTRLEKEREERYRGSQTPPGFRVGSLGRSCESCIYCRNLIRYEDEGNRYCEKYRTDVTVHHTCNSLITHEEYLADEAAKLIMEGKQQRKT